MDSWLAWNLSGGTAFVTDATNASRTLLLDLDRLAWDPELLLLFGIPEAALPTVRGSSAVVGTTRRLGLAPGRCAHRGAHRRLARGARGPRVPGAGHRQGDLRDGHVGDGAARRGGARRPSLRHGRVVDGDRRGALGPPARPGRSRPRGQHHRDRRRPRLDRRHRGPRGPRGGAGARSPRASRTPAASTSCPRSPAWARPTGTPDARGLISGLSRGTTAAHLVRAAFESIAYQVRDVHRRPGAGRGYAHRRGVRGRRRDAEPRCSPRPRPTCSAAAGAHQPRGEPRGARCRVPRGPRGGPVGFAGRDPRRLDADRRPLRAAAGCPHRDGRLRRLAGRAPACRERPGPPPPREAIA